MKYNIERGKRFYHIKKYDLAIREFEGMDLEPSENPELAYYMGLSLTQLKRYEEALNYLEQIVNSRYSFFHVNQCRMILGYIYSETGRFKLAEFEFLQTLKGGVRSSQVYSSLGHVYYRMRKIDESIDSLRQALSIDENYPNALNSLGYIYAEEEINKVKAIELCNKAVAIKPNNPSYLDSLGWAHYKYGRSAEAQGFLRRALELLPGNKEIAGHLKIATGSL
jgi:tetratricopeptide (TPR) repeat protein